MEAKLRILVVESAIESEEKTVRTSLKEKDALLGLKHDIPDQESER